MAEQPGREGAVQPNDRDGVRRPDADEDQGAIEERAGISDASMRRGAERTTTAPKTESFETTGKDELGGTALLGFARAIPRSGATPPASRPYPERGLEEVG